MRPLKAFGLPRLPADFHRHGRRQPSLPGGASGGVYAANLGASARRLRRIFFRSTAPITWNSTWATRARPRTIYRTAFGFRLAAYRGPETGTRDRASYVLVQNKIRLVLTTPLAPEHPIAEHVRLHGDGVRDIALWVDDAESAWRETTSRGARSVRDAGDAPRRARRSAHGLHRGLWRHHPHLRGAAQLQRRVSARLSWPWKAPTRWRGRWACSTSTTSWATWAGAR